MTSRQVTVRETQMAVHEAGEGTPLLLVHGFPFDHSMWDRQIEALSGKCRVIAPDLPGFGASLLPGERLTMELVADYLAEMLSVLQVKEPVVFCGLSMGGYVAWQFWARHRRQLKALVLCDTRAAADTEQTRDYRHRTAEQVLREGPVQLAEGMIPKLFAPRSLEDQPELIERVRAMILSTRPETIAAALRAMAARAEMTDRVAQIDCPTLLICGEHDAISPPEEMRQIALAIPRARLVLVPEAGHMAPLENPDAVNRAMEQFLEELAGA